MNPYWQNIETFWRVHEDWILSCPRNEWAVPVYEWDGLIRMTPIEDCLWHDIRNLNAVLYPQWPVAGFFVDFANPVAKVAVECDGAAYHQDKEKDERRDAKLRALGWSVYRFTGKECHRELDEDWEMYWAESGRERPPLAIEMLGWVCDHHGLRRTKDAIKAYSELVGQIKEPA